MIHRCSHMLIIVFAMKNADRFIQSKARFVTQEDNVS